MANLKECKTCGHLVARNAKRCPSCGNTNPHGNIGKAMQEFSYDGMKVIIGLIILFLILMFIL